MNSAEDPALTADQQKILALEKELAKKEKINQVLMKRIEKEYDSQGDAFSLFQAASSLEIEVKDRTIAFEKAMQELTNTNAKLEKTLLELEESQSRLILAEKMAALGQLISGIAHEVNTPLGVISSSIGNMTECLDSISGEQLLNIRSFSEESFELFLEFVRTADISTFGLSAREARAKRKGIANDLENIGVAESDEIADILVDAGIYDNIDRYYTLFKSKTGIDVLSAAVSYLHLKQNQFHIDLAVKKASKVVFALKKFAHHDSSDTMVKTDINDNIETVLTLYNNTLNQGITVLRQFSELPEIYCYPEEVSQIWTNLVFNAIQAMNNKGELSIESKRGNDDTIKITVTDNGPGIPPEIQGKIFDSFFTTKAAGEGTGLGLNIIKNIIEKHGGEIKVNSEPGCTSFTVTLPLRTEPV